jgi:type VI secretion system ImpM family protein
MDSAATWGLIGKLPRHADFVRCGVGADVFDAWLSRAVEALDRSQRVLPERVFRFVLPMAAKELVAGVLMPSRDKVGRRYPVAVVAKLPAAIERAGMAAWPLLLDAACGALEALVAELPEADAEDVTAKLQRCPQLIAASETGRRIPALLAELNVASFFERVLGTQDVAYASYAVRTMKMGVGMYAEATHPPSVGTILSCPVVIPEDLVAWLALAQCLAGDSTVTAGLVWSSHQTTPLHLCLGPSMPQLLSYIADPPADSPRVWPLVTEIHEARETARQAIGCVLEPLLQRQASLSEACPVLAREVM